MTSLLRSHIKEFPENTETLVLMSDVDEIPSSNTLALLRTCDFGSSLHLQLRNFLYRCVPTLPSPYLKEQHRRLALSGISAFRAGAQVSTYGPGAAFIATQKVVNVYLPIQAGIAAIASEPSRNTSSK